MARLDDGFSTTIAFADDSDVQLFEKEVTPPGIDAGGPIDTTTMQNTTYRTMVGKSLITLSESSLTVAYDTALYNEIVAMVGNNQQITITFPDATTIAFFGFIDKFTPNALVEGEQPTAEIVIVPTNTNTSGVETAPVIS